MSNAFMEGLGKVLGKIADQVQGRIERLKNEKQKIEEELKRIGDKYCTAGLAEKKSNLKKRLAEINNILANNAKD